MSLALLRRKLVRKRSPTISHLKIRFPQTLLFIPVIGMYSLILVSIFDIFRHVTIRCKTFIAVGSLTKQIENRAFPDLFSSLLDHLFGMFEFWEPAAIIISRLHPTPIYAQMEVQHADFHECSNFAKFRHCTHRLFQ